MGANPEKSLSDEATFAGAAKLRPASEVSIGDEQTFSDGSDAAGLDTAIDDIEVVDLEARYKIEGTLGQGGMGAVLLATDTRLGRKVAIKRILGESAGNRIAIQRFLTEAKAIAALNHPNIVQIYDYGRAKDGPFLIMEYVDGGSLANRCQQGAIPLDESVTLACQLCDGLAKAHALGIIHRDIKPANVLLTKDGAPKLSDFGLAKAPANDHSHTMTGAVLGTPDFMPPEQRRDASLVDHRSDLWSLAATVYHMVTGRSPKIILFKNVPVSLQEVLAKALEDRKDARYQSAQEFRDALKTGLLSTAPNTVVAAAGEGQCPSCGVQNDTSRNFCRGCGESLFAPCLSCSKQMPMWEEICGSCGAKQSQLVDKQRQAMAARQAEAEGLWGDFEFDAATAVATELQGQAHQRLRHLSAWAATFIARIEESRAEQTRLAVEAIGEAGKHELAYDYAAAIMKLEAIPKSLRSITLANFDETADAILARLKKNQAEVRRLESLVREHLKAQRIDATLPYVNALLELRPTREDVKRLRGQLLEQQRNQAAARDRAIAQAKMHLSLHNYAEATDALKGVATTAVTPEAAQLRERAEQLGGQVRILAKTIHDAINVKHFDGLLSVVDSYLKLKPRDAEMIRVRQSLVEREELINADVSSREKRSQLLEKACRIDEAIELLEGIPQSRRSPEARVRIERLRRFGAFRESVMATLMQARKGTYANALEVARRYKAAIDAAAVSDPEFTSLLEKTNGWHDADMLSRRRLFLSRTIATVALTLLLLVPVGYDWIRSGIRASRLAEALAQRRWNDALAIESKNVTALVGRALGRLQAAPADINGAFGDLLRAERLQPSSGIVASAFAEVHAVRAAHYIREGIYDSAAEDLARATFGGAPAAIVTPTRLALEALAPIRNSIGITLKLIPAGSLTLGNVPGASETSRPHTITITEPFYFGVHEVTTDQWQRVLGKRTGDREEKNLPAIVSWFDAQRFCEAISRRPEEQQAGREYRLPTRAEWEYACRAGTTTRYAFGDGESDLAHYGWFLDNSGQRPHPVGQKKPNAWGLHDVHGNVWEWCHESGDLLGSEYIRGGGWQSHAASCCSGYRPETDRHIRLDSSDVGFRLVMTKSKAMR